ncbi:hypothetical protein HMPREF9080_01597 [Cardiobacterium valvarum F0432]|uniref:Uncharacterized protein n=1 Tax=Cardiobacterium valvarum F0432 TaxID=797473 RepID=G9ZFN3_9GAMM|nr:hypothetical protein HMPREF9080_01597 [Cardiobacterium valvarum F0432]
MRLFMVYSIRFSDDVHPPQGARIIATVREIYMDRCARSPSGINAGFS